MSLSHLQPFLPKSLSSDLISEFVTNRYKIKPQKPLKQIEGGIESAVWLVTTKKEKWLVKVFGLREGPVERVEEEMILLYEYLNKHGINVPEIRHSIQGLSVERLKFKSAIYPLVLIKFEDLRECTPPTIKRHELIILAKTVAKMHQILKKSPCFEKYIKESLLAEKPEVLTTGAYSTFIKSPNAEIFNQDELKQIEVLDQKMVKYAKIHLLRSNLSHSIIHGDLALEHAQFLSNGEVYFFDFADRSWAPIALDLAILLVHLYRVEDIPFERWEKLKSWVISGYTSVNELTPEDHAAIKPLMIYRLLDEIKWLSEKAIEFQHEVDAAGIKRRYKLSEYLLNQ